jgi:hypothetical protein
MHYQIRISGAMADVSLLKLAPETAPLDRFRDNLRTLAVAGRTWREFREVGLGLYVTMLTVDLTPTQRSLWRLDSLEGGRRYRERMRMLADLSRSVLQDWQLDEPEKQAPKEQLQRIQYWEKKQGASESNPEPQRPRQP